MNNSQIRVKVEYKEEKVAVLISKNLGEKSMIQTILKEFDLDPKDWELYDIYLQLDCKIKSSNLIRFEDERLFLKEKKPKNFDLQLSINSRYNSQDSQLPKESRSQIIFDKELNQYQKLSEITMSKDPQEFEELKSDLPGEGFIKEEAVKFEDEDENSTKEESPQLKDNEINFAKNSSINLKEIEEKKFSNREDLKDKVIKIWGGNNKMTLNFRSQERILKKDGVKVSIIYCSKKETLGCPFFLEIRTDSQDKIKGFLITQTFVIIV